MKAQSRILSVSLIALMVTACSDSDSSASLAIYQNIVTFAGNSPTSAIFEYQEIDDSPIVRLAVTGSVNAEKVPAGTRLLMTYSLPDDINYGDDCPDVTLRGLQTIYTDTLSIVTHGQALEANAPIHLTTLYRTGPYINLYCSMPALPSRKYHLVADESTLRNDTIQMFLTTSVPEEKPAYNSTQVASIYLGETWTEASDITITVNVNNTNNIYRRHFTFHKP